MTRKANVLMVLAVLLTVIVGACAKKTPPVARPMPPPTTNTSTVPPRPPEPPNPVSEPVPVAPEPLKDDGLTSPGTTFLANTGTQPVGGNVTRSAAGHDVGW